MKHNALLKQNEWDALIITSPKNRRYFSSFTGSEGVLLLQRDKQILYVDGRYTTQANEQAKNATVVEFEQSAFEALASFGFQRVGFEDATISYAQHQKLADALPGVQLFEASGAIDKLRMIKSPDEIAAIQQAATIADNAFSHIVTWLRPGLTERQIALELEVFMRQQGAEGLSFAPIVAAGERSALPHATPTDRPIKQGDLLLMDFGCVYNGYCSDMTRTVAVGHVSDHQRELYDTVLSAQQACLQKLAPGMACKQADAIARNLLEQVGFQLVHSTGHGVGLDVHEEPRLSLRSDQVLTAGMVVTVEPGVYQPGVGGVRIEDMVCITESGLHNFTASTKQLLVI